MRDFYKDDFTEDEIWCGSGEHRIYAKRFLPAVAGKGQKIPLVLFCPELYKTHESGDPYAAELAGRGIAAVTLDCRGSAEESRSPGSMQNMSVLTCMEDLFTVYDEARTWNFVDPDRIAAIGASQGAFATAIAASVRPEAFARIVLMYGAFVILDDVRDLFPDRESVPEVFSYHGWSMMGARYLTDLWDFEPESLASYKRPVLVLHGDHDPLVAPSYSEKIAGLYETSEYHLIGGGRHGFRKKAFDEAVRYILLFLERGGF